MYGCAWTGQVVFVVFARFLFAWRNVISEVMVVVVLIMVHLFALLYISVWCDLLQRVAKKWDVVGRVSLARKTLSNVCNCYVFRLPLVTNVCFLQAKENIYCF